MIGPLTEADRPRWTELWGAYLAFYETELPAATYDGTWSRIMADTDIHALGFRRDGSLIGIVHYLFHAHSWSPQPACYLQDLYIDATARGTGAGRALIEAVADKARTAGATRLYWTTQGTNATARQLYDRLARNRGYVKYEYPL